MKSLKRTFEENFQAVEEPCDNKRGFKIRYVYIGLWYVWNLPKERIQTAKRLMGLACVFSVLLFLLGSLADSSLNYYRFVEFPGLLSIVALLYEGIGVVQFCAAKEKMTEMDFHDIQTKLLIAPLLHGALLACAVLAAVWKLFSMEPELMDIIVPLCYFFSGLLSLLTFFYFRSLPYRKEKNEDAKIGSEDGLSRP